MDFLSRNRKGLEALCRYIARPPLAKSRLVVDDEEGEYRILLKTPWSDGTTSIQVGLLELIERLAAIIPQPRTHRGCIMVRLRIFEFSPQNYTKPNRQ